MIFASVPIESAVGALLAHRINGQGLTLPKGRKLTEADVASLSRAGHRGGRRRSSRGRRCPGRQGGGDGCRQSRRRGVSIAPAATGRATALRNCGGGDHRCRSRASYQRAP